MAVSKAKKVEQLAVLEAHLKEATSVGFTSNTKVTVLEVSNLKKDLRAQNAIFLTAKKTLIRIAFKNVYGVEVDINTLPGQVALVIAKGDAIAPLGVANKYANEWKKEQKLTFVAGYMEGRLMDGAETKKLATLPSREVLLAKLLGSMMSPLSGLARFFDAAGKDITAKGVTKVSDLV
jgi:large subunit ribosomal protein L10